MSELNAPWITIAGLFELAFKSKLKAAKEFSKIGSYNSKCFYNKLGDLKDFRQFASARGREYVLHYDVVEHIETRYSDAIVQSGFGEYLATTPAAFDAQLKGYTAGPPDITILRGLPNGFQDGLALVQKPERRGM